MELADAPAHRWVSRERPDFVRSAPERCWIDGDLIRLSQFPVGGIRPGARGKPVPWLMDLTVLEEAMREVYGGGFRLGDRAPLLQLAADALADGDRCAGAWLQPVWGENGIISSRRVPIPTTQRAIMSMARTTWSAFPGSFIGLSAPTTPETRTYPGLR